VASCWSQKPCGLKHKVSSLFRTLGPWDWNYLKVWMSVCICSVFVFSCVGRSLAVGWSPVQGILPAAFKIHSFHINSKIGKGQRAYSVKVRRRINFLGPLLITIWDSGGPSDSLHFIQCIRLKRVPASQPKHSILKCLIFQTLHNALSCFLSSKRLWLGRFLRHLLGPLVNQ
jgi:hypothetical protein